MYQLFQNYHSPIPEIIKWTKDENLIWNDIIDLKPINRFAFHKVHLISDAAHATTPNMGQGACQAIEDAIILKQVLKKSIFPEEAFVTFEKLRSRKTKKVVKLSWQIGKIAQLHNPFLIPIRNSIMRILPSTIQEKQLESVFETDF